jgi:hypothetical protein
LVALAIAAAVLLSGGGGGDQTASGATAGFHLTILSQHPLGRRAAERLLEERYVPIRDDDTASVRCSGRIPKPAHSVRRCMVRYPGGVERRVVLLTTANGAEVLSKP